MKVKNIDPLPNHVLITDMFFGESVRRGVIVLDDNGTDRGIRPRWARVWKVGKNIKDVEVGEYVLVSHGRWTRFIDVGEEETIKVARVDYPDGILLISKDNPEKDD